MTLIDRVLGLVRDRGCAGLGEERHAVAAQRRRSEPERSSRIVVDRLLDETDVISTLLGVTVLGYDDQLVEIEAVAAVVD